MPMGLLPSSFAVAHQTDEDVLEGALASVQVLEADTEIAQALEQGRNARALLVAVESVFQLAPAGLQRQSPVAQLQGDRGQRLEKIERQLLLAELFYQLDFFLDPDPLALCYYPHPGGH